MNEIINYYSNTQRVLCIVIYIDLAIRPDHLHHLPYHNTHLLSHHIHLMPAYYCLFLQPVINIFDAQIQAVIPYVRDVLLFCSSNNTHAINLIALHGGRRGWG